MGTPIDRFVRLLTSRHRVIVLGGLAVIAHGLSRSTYDGDIWLEPMADAETWSAELERCCRDFGELTLHRLPGWTPVSGEEIITAVVETGIIRVLGLDCPLDVFRVPNEIEAEDFDAMYSRGTVRSDGSMLPDPLDLLQSKMDTGRDKDRLDIGHLESVVRQTYREQLPLASFEKAQAMLARYSEWQVLQAALENPSPEVRDLAMSHLREFAAAGDPFSLAILEGREIP
jgi:hypothetical protein